MTREQLDFFTEQTERAARKGGRIGARSVRRDATIAFLVLLAGLLLAFYLQSQDQDARRDEIESSRRVQILATQAASVSNCNALFLSVTNTRKLLVRLDEANLAQYRARAITRQQRDRAHKFYAQLTNELKLPDCRKQAKLISLDPTRPIPHLTPRYPGDKRGISP